MRDEVRIEPHIFQIDRDTGTVWRVRWRDDGTQHSVTTESLENARAIKKANVVPMVTKIAARRAPKGSKRLRYRDELERAEVNRALIVNIEPIGGVKYLPEIPPDNYYDRHHWTGVFERGVGAVSEWGD